jgi:hypothetical protein
VRQLACMAELTGDRGWEEGGERTPLPSLTSVLSASSFAWRVPTRFRPDWPDIPSIASSWSRCLRRRFLSLPCRARFSPGVSSDEATRSAAEGGLKTSSGASNVEARSVGGRADSSEIEAVLEIDWMWALG